MIDNKTFIQCFPETLDILTILKRWMNLHRVAREWTYKGHPEVELNWHETQWDMAFKQFDTTVLKVTYFILIALNDWL